MAAELTRAVVLALALATSSAGCVAQTVRARSDYPAAQMFRNYALSTCLSDASTDVTSKADAAAAAAAYLELGEGPLEAYTEAAKLGRTFLDRKYQGSRDLAYHTMKCIDLFHSEELDTLTRKYFKGAR